jgi:pimeloyl-ACP methyl ester carboxylesterase
MLFAATVTAIAAVGCSPAKGTRQHAALQPCRLAGIEDELLCGKLTVFENRETRAGRTIDLNVVVFPALEPSSKEAPLFDLAGGPGVGATTAAFFYAREGKEFRRRRDVVLVDQRGTGKSNPLAAAPKARAPQDYLTELYPEGYVEALRRALEQKADLTQYTTSIAMDDLDDVRAWLGYERVDLFGLSYGTRAALVYLRQHPERVRSVVLMGVAPTNLKVPLRHASAAKRALDLLFEDCARDARCAAAFPDVAREWEELMLRLNAEPARVAYRSRENSGETMLEIRAEIFAEKVRNRMYSAAGARQVPLIIHCAAHGDFAPFLQLVLRDGASAHDGVAAGAYLAVTCSEDTAFIDPGEAARINAGNPFGNYRVDQQIRACGVWPRGELPAGFHEPVTSDVPVLIISGKMDPVTPPERGDEVARHLPNSRHVVIPHHAHSPIGLSNFACVHDLIVEFFSKADASQLDLGCLDTIQPPPFATKPSEL